MNRMRLVAAAAVVLQGVLGFSPIPIVQLKTHGDIASTHVECCLQAGKGGTECWNPRLRSIIGGISLTGVVETAYLTQVKLGGGEVASQICGIGGGTCSSVLDSSYALIPGTEIPLAALGFVAYSSVATLALSPLTEKNGYDDSTNRLLLTSLTTSMGVFSVFLMTLLFGVLEESCSFCVASAIFSIVMAKLVWLGGCLPEKESRRGIGASIGSSLAAFVGAIVLFTNGAPPSSAVNFAGELPGTTTTVSIAGTAPPAITTESSPQALQLANDMQKLNTRFFGAFWCSHCYDQKQAMGKEAMTMIPYIECSRDGLNAQTQLCKEREVPGYPTWEINGKLYPGEKSLDELTDIVSKIR